MDIPYTIWGGGILLLALVFCVWLIARLLRNMVALKSKLRSQSTRHGLLAEQLIPFSKKFPGDPKNFRFLGSPIDGVLFEDDKIIVVEFKSGRSQLSQRQKHIKDLIDKGRVYFQEIRVAG